MARKARKRAASGIYYVRLNSNSPLFLQGRDLVELLNLLTTERETDFCEIYAYCMIDCEAHLVMKEGLGGISSNIMRIKSGFASYYNTVYVRKGALFTGRFYSEPLEDNTQVLKYVRRVHRTPLKFGQKIDFEGSSYSEYFKNRPLLSSSEIIALYKSGVDFKIYTEETGQESDSAAAEIAATDSIPTDFDYGTESNIELTAEHQGEQQENTDQIAEQQGNTVQTPEPQGDTIQTPEPQGDTIQPAEETEKSDVELRAQIKALLKEVTPEELEALTEEQYKLLITRIIRLTNSTPQAVARVLEIDLDEI